ncbi:MAG TPA: putative Ig domain-containing protein, partial [Niastella sp.]|nr:putative Ig domain-containing protein [Niastella sp.]
MKKIFLLPVLLGMFSYFFISPPSFHFSGALESIDRVEATTTTVGVAADAYTYSGTYADINYGTGSYLVVKTTSGSAARSTYLRFPLNNVSGSVSKAVLRVYGRCTDVGVTTTIGAFGVTDDSWNENTITWNNAPAATSSTPLSTVSLGNTSVFADLDVTSFVQAQMAGDKTVSFVIKQPSVLNRFVQLNSRENSKNGPQLIVTVNPSTNATPVLAPIGNKTVTFGQSVNFTASATDADAGQSLTYSLVNAPLGATIDAATGAFNWTPETATNATFTVRVTDNATTPLSDEEEITVTVLSNQAPVLSAIANQYTNINQAVSFTASATDPDAGQVVHYALIDGPDGATIDPATGQFNWTPTSAATVTFTVRATDDGTPNKFDEKQVTIQVTANQAPVITGIENKEGTVGETLTFTAMATDADTWQSKTFSLPVAPSGASIDPATGVFTWTPAATGGYQVTVRVTDNGMPVLYDDEEFIINVSTLNRAPVLDPIGNKNGTVGQLLSFTATASDPDAGQIKNFYLIDAPAGASIDASTGAFTWTPDFPGTYIFTVHVSDNASPALTDEEQITVTIVPVNRAPVLATIGSKSATVGQLVTFTASANDLDDGQTKTYSLSNAPAGATINASSGVFNWTPGSTGSFQFTVRVTDNGSPALSDEEDVTVSVNSLALTTLSAIADAYTNNGVNADINYGTASYLVVKTTTGTSAARASYLKFPLSSLTGTISSAVLRVYGRCTDAGVVTSVAAYPVSNDSWTETGITWNNAPAASGGALSTVGNIGNASQYFDFDVTSYVQSELSGDKTASFLLQAPSNLNKFLQFNSRNNTKYQPQLVISKGGSAANQAPVLDAIGNRTATSGQPYSFTAHATDVNGGQSLTYSLENGPAGATIDPVTGIFNWTPSIVGSETFSVKVTDNGSPVLYDDEQITITVTSSPTTKTFSNTQSQSIPNPGKKEIPIQVSGLPSVADTTTYGLQSLSVNITHPSDKELTLQLKAPDGKVIYLFRKSPGVNISTTFDGVA